MADNGITIDPASVIDNPTDLQVEFRGEVDGERYDFAVRHSVIEALTGRVPDAPATDFAAVSDQIAKAALVALGRGSGDDLVIVSENDLDQPIETAPPAADVAEAEAHPS
ncbi:hypothetical protein JW805_12310 [Roseomonas aeriglobus]|nr:hypothetical protein [Roseomonas aeriglobus]